MPRWQLLLGQVLATALPLAVLVAWQSALLVAAWPVLRFFQGVFGAVSLPSRTPGAYGVWWVVANSELFSLLVPATPGNALTLLLLVAAPAIVLPAALLHTGPARLAATVMAVAAGGLCLALVAAIHWGLGLGIGLALGLPLLALLAAAWLWALRALRRAELAV